MIKCERAKVEVKGDVYTTVGPELVITIGYILDALAMKVGRKEAERFIEICVESALDRVPDEKAKKINEEAMQYMHLTEDEILDLFGFCQ